MKKFIIDSLKKMDKTFVEIKKSAIGNFIIERVILKSKNYYTVVTLFGTYLVGQLIAYNEGTNWSNKVQEELDSSDGLIHFIWWLISWIVPGGSLLTISGLASIILGTWIIRYKELNQNNRIERLIPDLKEKTKNILFEIRTNIEFKHSKIEIDRSETIDQIKNQLNSKQILIVCGDGGVGKTSIIKKIYENIEINTPFYVIKARIFQSNNLFTNYTLKEFIDIHKEYSKKIIVIDSAEALLDFESEYFKEVISTLITHEWKIVFTTRYTYLDDLNYHFANILNINPFKIDIKNLSKEELIGLSNTYEFNLPQDEKLFNLIQNPFYLNEYLSYYSEEEIQYEAFKNTLWNQNIIKSNPQREDCFIKLAFARANEGRFYISVECFSNSLETLRKDGILGHEKAGYFISHDIYEEWALNKIIENSYIQQSNEKDFFVQIGSSLSIRRAFRNWISEKLLLNDKGIKTFIENIIDNSSIESFWKDEILVSVLLSNYSDTFFDNFKNELMSNDYEFLVKISFLLRLACQDRDDTTLKNIGIKSHEVGEIDLIFTKPKGKGWESFITFIHDNIETIKLEKIDVIVPILNKWTTKNEETEVTKYASLIALKYYELINQSEYTNRSQIKNICRVIINGSSLIKEELLNIFNDIDEKKFKKHSDNYYELSEMILADFEGLKISKVMPEQVLKLANLFWTKEDQQDEGKRSLYERKEIEHAFNITDKYDLKYSPSSAFQTPIYSLLKIDYSITIDFIISFINKSVEHYVNSKWQYKENIETVNVYINEKTIVEQYHSQALWNLYRGTSSPLMPDLLQSIHMALEKWLLDLVKLKELDFKALELLLIRLLRSSKSSSITAIIASVVLSKPYKTFNIATILFKTKEFIDADFTRCFKDISNSKFMYGMGYDRDYKNKIFQEERIKTCDDKHRQNSLQDLCLNYQIFRTKEIKEKDVQSYQTILWKILDKYHDELPPKEKQTDKEKEWNIRLSKMDRRGMTIKPEKINGQDVLSFNPELSPELQEYSEKIQKESSHAIKYTQLNLWARQKIENNEEFKKYKQYEDNPYYAFKQIKEVSSISNDKRDFIFQNETFPHVCIILLKDYPDLLNKEDKIFCKSILLEFAYIGLRENYMYQISDGLEETIEYLPLLMKFFPSHDLKTEIKTILMLYLFDDYKVAHKDNHLYDFAIKAISNYLNDCINSYIGNYLILKPKYDEKMELNYHSHRKEEISKDQIVDNFINENQSILEEFVSNNKISISLESLEGKEFDVLIVIFKMIFKLNISIEREFTQKIIEKFLINILNDYNDEMDTDLKNEFIITYSEFLLNIKKDDIDFYLKPLLEQFTPNEEVVELLTYLVLNQMEINNYDNFWHIWNLLEEEIVKLCENGDNYSYICEIIKAYLLVSGRYVYSFWDSSTKEWHSFRERDKRFVKKLSEKIGHCPTTLYAVSSLLTTIASSYLDDGISWIANMLQNNSNLKTDKLHPDVVYNLEILTRKYIFMNGVKIKKDRKSKGEVLKILNFLINKGSSIAYMLREKIL